MTVQYVLVDQGGPGDQPIAIGPYASEEEAVKGAATISVRVGRSLSHLDVMVIWSPGLWIESELS